MGGQWGREAPAPAEPRAAGAARAVIPVAGAEPAAAEAPVEVEEQEAVPAARVVPVAAGALAVVGAAPAAETDKI
jgi:hypothetical protein